MTLPPESIELHQAAEAGDVDALALEIARLHGALNVEEARRRSAQDALAGARAAFSDLVLALSRTNDPNARWSQEALFRVAEALGIE